MIMGSGLNVKDLIKDKVYYLTEGNNINDRIVRFSECKELFDEIVLVYKIRLAVTGSDMQTISKMDHISNKTLLNNIREATQNEIEWLEACEKAGKYVDKPVKQEFIVGRWYKGWKNSCKLYAKLYKISEECFYWTDAIYNSRDGLLKFFNKEGYNNWENEPNNLVEASLEEIQQYLPENHIDKIKVGFKKDDYIVLLKDCSGGNSWSDQIPINHCYQLARDSYEDNRGFEVYASIKGTSNGWSTGNKSFVPKLQFRHATKEEIAHYNQIGKPYDVSTLTKSEYLKPEELVEGEWYECLKNCSKWLFKFNKLGSNSIDTLKVYKIAIKYKRETIGGFVTSDITNIKPADPQEVLKYFPEEIPNNKLTFEEALIECKKRYPIGTKFHPLTKNYPNGYSDQTFTIGGNNFIDWNKGSFKSKEAIVETSTYGILWYNGVFAEIVDDKCTVNITFDSDINRYEATSKELFTPLIVDHIGYLRDKSYQTLLKGKSNKLEIFIEPISPIKVEPIVELKIKKISKLTV